jgi:hypothetical protein
MASVGKENISRDSIPGRSSPQPVVIPTALCRVLLIPCTGCITGGYFQAFYETQEERLFCSYLPISDAVSEPKP